MSASAFVVLPDSIIALSDGLEVHLETLERVSKNQRKIFKISDQTLITSSGNIIKDDIGRKIPEMVQDRARRRGITDPEGVAQLVRPLAVNAPPEADLLNYTVMGFDDSGRVRRFHFTHEDRSGTEKPINTGMVGVMAHECDELAYKMFQKLLNEKYNAGQGLPVLQAAKQAWTETIRHCEDNFLFGGEIFMEVVSKKKVNA